MPLEAAGAAFISNVLPALNLIGLNIWVFELILVPPSIIRRPKQPYRAPDAIAFCSAPQRGWVSEVLDEAALRKTGFFDPGAVARLWSKCRERGEAALSNTDNMALTGVLSTQLLALNLQP